MRRLLIYLRLYRLIVAASLVLLLIDSLLQIIGPLLTKLAVDKYLVPVQHPTHTLLDAWLSKNAWTGVSQLAALYMAVVVLGFFFDFGQTYLMQWTGQKAM